MPISLFRTHRTWLTEDQLLLLDVLFHGGAQFRLLRREGFLKRLNCQPHELDDDQLRCNLQWLCEHGVLTTEQDEGKTWFHMTANGGELWSQERCPVWERYCLARYRVTSRNRELRSVIAVSPQIRDDFLALWPPPSARRRTFTVTGNDHLLGWRAFHPAFVGVAIHEEETVWEMSQRFDQIESQRTWWDDVYELQRFVAKTV